MNDSNSPTSKDIPNILINSVERIIEAKFFFLFGSFVFALDCGINFLTHKNLYNGGNELNLVIQDWGKFLVFLLIFSFTMAFAMKIMRWIIEEIISDPAIYLSVRLSSKKSNQTRLDNSEYYPSKSMMIALDRGDKLLYEISERKDKNYRTKLFDQINNAQISFSVLVFMILNRFIFGNQNSPTLLREIAIWADNEGVFQHVLVWSFWIIVISSWISNAFIIDVSPEKVYVPDSTNLDIREKVTRDRIL